MIRVGVGGIVHETNTYADDSSGRTPFSAFHTDRGQELLGASRTRSGLGGILASCESIGALAAPLIWSATQPSGTIEHSAYVELKRMFLDSLEEAMSLSPLDALSLDLHGAGVVQGIEDLEGDLGLSIRKVVGREVPIVVTLDLHAHISQVMVDVFDVMIGYRLYPHTDMWETGYEATQLIPSLLHKSLQPHTHVEYLPMLLPTSTTDAGHPAALMNEVTAKIEAWPGVVDCSVFHGFPYTDVSGNGVYVVTTTNGDPVTATSASQQAATWIWDHRDDFRIEQPTPEQAVQIASSHLLRPVVINETSDNCGAGAPGDGTHLLRAMLDAKLTEAVFGFICDPEVAQQAHNAGVGTTIHVRLGGKHGSLHGEPIEADAYIKSLTDGRFVLTAMSAGDTRSIGLAARLVIDGVDVIVGSARMQTFDPELFLLHGIDVLRYQTVALKSSQHFRAGFRDLAARIVTADSPGLSTLRVDAFERHQSTRPLWPIDPSTHWMPGMGAFSSSTN